jgi:hypothetical protein
MHAGDDFCCKNKRNEIERPRRITKATQSDSNSLYAAEIEPKLPEALRLFEIAGIGANPMIVCGRCDWRDIAVFIVDASLVAECGRRRYPKLRCSALRHSLEIRVGRIARLIDPALIDHLRLLEMVLPRREYLAGMRRESADTAIGDQRIHVKSEQGVCRLGLAIGLPLVLARRKLHVIPAHRRCVVPQ